MLLIEPKGWGLQVQEVNGDVVTLDVVSYWLKLDSKCTPWVGKPLTEDPNKILATNHRSNESQTIRQNLRQAGYNGLTPGMINGIEAETVSLCLAPFHH